MRQKSQKIRDRRKEVRENPVLSVWQAWAEQHLVTAGFTSLLRCHCRRFDVVLGDQGFLALHGLIQGILHLADMVLRLLRCLRRLLHCRLGGGMVLLGLDKMAIDRVKRGDRFGIVGRREILPHGHRMLPGKIEMMAEGGVRQRGDPGGNVGGLPQIAVIVAGMGVGGIHVRVAAPGVEGEVAASLRSRIPLSMHRHGTEQHQGGCE